MLSFDLTAYPYTSQRRVCVGSRGAVATSQPLATLAGMEMLLAGGNAVDAAVAMAIALTVVEPTSNGIGGDALALVWDGRLHGLNASGRSPAQLDPAAFAGLTKMPEVGWPVVTVPGAVAAWRSLWERWGRLPFAQLFAPALRYARDGFAVSPVTATAWQAAAARYLLLAPPEFQPFKAVFFPGDRAPRPGEVWASPAHVKTLQAIASTGGESFYRGKLAGRLVDFAATTGGWLSAADLANHAVAWVEPLATTYGDLTVWELPPNTQGLAALLALNILQGCDLQQYPRESVESYHLQIEAMKLAFADVYRHVADPEHMTVSPAELLAPSYAAARRALIQAEAQTFVTSGLPRGGTVYLCAADGELMVSLIQSNYNGFGSGILIPDTGIALHNRGSGFSPDPDHPNAAAPNKRPFHTIIPSFFTRDGQPLGPFGVMGAPMQPQGHVQVAVNLANYGLNPQAALDAPRWRFLRGDRVLLESAAGAELATALGDRGHNLTLSPRYEQFGKGQIILRHGKTLVAASEPRADGCALAY
ncbi:MAG: gamma-glutamyltransferase family protein [Spirulinaceae cyanobacterium SM2_1_0]|nr:gamma-glutamyltransferase family protein [Spirulinaceae cyanobacterium SM2_1_0]